jgi:hypothetical protein
MVNILPDGETGWRDQLAALTAEDVALCAAGEGPESPHIRHPIATIPIAANTI